MKTETIYQQSGAFGNLSIKIDGLSVLLNRLEAADPKLRRAMIRGLKEATSPVLTEARANARRIGDDGTFEGSLSIGSRKGGTRYVLRSNDPAAGVKEFARLGAKTVSANGSPLSISRLRMRSGVGVPKRAHAPRVMVNAVEDNLEVVRSRVEEQLATVLGEIHG